MPLYYGLWAFATATANSSIILAADVKSTNPFIKAWHVRDSNGFERVVVLHKDPANNAVPPTTADVTIVPSTSNKARTGLWVSSTVNSLPTHFVCVFLRAFRVWQMPASIVSLSPGPQGLASKAGLSFGGLTFDGSQNGVPVGQWTPKEVAWNSAANGYTLTLAQGSAVIVSLPL
jgi:hypothetical protein